MSNITIIIPSRLSAERLPNKPLKLIKNKEMIVHVHDRAMKSGIGNVIVATPDQEILNLIKNNLSYNFKQKVNGNLLFYCWG